MSTSRRDFLQLLGVNGLAAATLQLLGFARATDLDGGFQAWRQEGLPVR